MRPATVSVGLVSPRSTCESIGAETPQRSARSRSDSPIASRSAFTRGPMVSGTSIAVTIHPYVIAYGAGRLAPVGRTLSPMSRLALATLLAFALAAAPAAAQDPLRAQQWGLDLINADAARSVTTGQGALVAVIDSGVRLDHPDLAGRLAPGRDLVQDDDVPQD